MLADVMLRQPHVMCQVRGKAYEHVKVTIVSLWQACPIDAMSRHVMPWYVRDDISGQVMSAYFISWYAMMWCALFMQGRVRLAFPIGSTMVWYDQAMLCYVRLRV